MIDMIKQILTKTLHLLEEILDIHPSNSRKKVGIPTITAVYYLILYRMFW